MNDAHFHLVVNHLPIVGIVIGLLTLVVGMLLKKDQVKATALSIFIFSALASIAAFYTGEGAEEAIENISGISETLIHKHEEQAELFFTLTLIMGAIAMLTLLLQIKNSKYTKYLYILTLLFSVTDVVVAKYVGTSGGEIRHTEIRNSSQVIQVEDEDEDHR